MIETRGLTRIYRLGESELRALDGVDLRVEPGEFVALMGASGSGKSTLMHLLGLLDEPSEGSYRLFGEETSHLGEDERAALRSRSLGFVFQQFNLLPRTSALENTALPRLYHPEPLRPGEAEEILRSVGLGERMGHSPAQLSGGQQQRVAIARALVNRPRLLFADEPTGNLDSRSSLEIMELFRGLNAQGITVVLVTHESDIAEHARRVITLKDGRIVSDRGRPEAAKPLAPAAAPELAPRRGVQATWRAWTGYLRQAGRAMLSNRLRTMLSVLGILIGVMAVVAVMAIGAGVKGAVKQQMSALGTNLLLMWGGGQQQGGANLGAGSVARFQEEDAASIARAVPELAMAGPEINGRAQAVGSKGNWNTQVTGAAVVYAAMRNAAPVMGRFFTEEEYRDRARVAVMGVTVARNIFGDVNPVGKDFLLNRISFKVVGVLPAKGSNGWQDRDDVVVMPCTTAQRRVLGRDRVDLIAMQVRDGIDMEEAQRKIKATMRQRLKLLDWQDDNFTIMNLADIQATFTSTMNTITSFSSIIAVVSLLVGGIGIMNIMLVSVTERTREIGLRKALGARQADIQAQFLLEAVAVTLLGGLGGLALGAGLAALVSLALGWPVTVSLGSVLLAVGVSTAIGLAFGFWPARQAARLDPIAALRYE